MSIFSFVRNLFKQPSKPLQTVAISKEITKPFDWLAYPEIRPGGTQEVKGESFYQNNLLKVSGGKTYEGTKTICITAELVREFRNPHDSNAVRVDVGGLPVGFIPNIDAPKYHNIIKTLADLGKHATCRAYLKGGWYRGPNDEGHIGIVYRGPNDEGHIGIVLDIHPSISQTDSNTSFLPGGNKVSVVGEEKHQDHIRDLFERHGSETVTATLEIAEAGKIEILIEGQRVGQLTPKMTERYLEWITKVSKEGFPTTCNANLEQGKKKIEAFLDLSSPSKASTERGKK